MSLTDIMPPKVQPSHQALQVRPLTEMKEYEGRSHVMPA